MSGARRRGACSGGPASDRQSGAPLRLKKTRMVPTARIADDSPEAKSLL